MFVFSLLSDDDDDCFVEVLQPLSAGITATAVDAGWVLEKQKERIWN